MIKKWVIIRILSLDFFLNSKLVLLLPRILLLLILLPLLLLLLLKLLRTTTTRMFVIIFSSQSNNSSTWLLRNQEPLKSCTVLVASPPAYFICSCLALKPFIHHRGKVTWLYKHRHISAKHSTGLGKSCFTRPVKSWESSSSAAEKVHGDQVSLSGRQTQVNQNNHHKRHKSLIN